MRPPTEPRDILVIDGGSAQLSVAIGSEREVAAERSAPADRSSSTLVRLLDDCLCAAGLAVADVGGIVALRGPGSFTGLRVGLALVQGLHQAVGVPVGTLGSFEVLAEQVDGSVPVRAAVRAGRDTWNTRLFAAGSPRRPVGPASRLPTARLAEAAAGGPPVVVGFGVAALAGPEVPPERLREAAPLAAFALQSIGSVEWDAATLTSPLYLAPPPADPGAAAAAGRAGRRGDRR